MKKSRIIFGALLFLISFSVYLFTLAPFPDSEVSLLSSHPLLSLITRIWFMIPHGDSPMLWANVFSALIAAFSAYIFYETALLISKSLPFRRNFAFRASALKTEATCFFAALFYSFGMTVWSNATAFGPTVLNLLLANLVFHFFLKGIFAPEKKAAYYSAGAFAAGLAVADNPVNIAFLLPIAILYLFPANRGSKTGGGKPVAPLLIISAFAAGASICLYTLSNEVYGATYLLRFRAMSLSAPDTGALVSFLRSFPEEFAATGIIIMIYGLYVLYRISKALFIVLIFIILIQLTLVIFGRATVEFYPHALIAMHIAVVAGLLALLNLQQKLLPAFALLPLMVFISNVNERLVTRSQDTEEIAPVQR